MTVLVSLLAGGGTASSPESTVTDFCNALKNFDLRSAVSYFDGRNDELENLYSGSFKTEQLMKYLKNSAAKITYTIGKTKIEKNKAEVPVVFIYVDASSVLSEAVGDYIKQAFSLAFSEKEESELENLFETIFLEKTESTNIDIQTCNVIFNCVNADGIWKIGPINKSAQDAIVNIVTCNIYNIFSGLEKISNFY